MPMDVFQTFTRTLSSTGSVDDALLAAEQLLNKRSSEIPRDDESTPSYDELNKQVDQIRKEVLINNLTQQINK